MAKPELDGKTQKRGDWLKFCRVCLEWLHPRQDYTPESCEQWIVNVIERAQSLNINTLMFDLYHGGYAIFNGSVAPKDRHIGEVDLLSILDREVHRRGMKLLGMHMASYCNKYQSAEYPQWVLRDAQGNPQVWGAHAMQCLNTPWVNYYLQELRGALSRYHLDGLYIEGVAQGACYCDFCLTEFKKRYGYDLPRDPEALRTCPDFPQFNKDIVNNYVRRVREVIDEVSPDTIWIPCNASHDSPGVYSDYATWGKYTDAVELERCWGAGAFQIPLRDLGMSMQLIGVESGRPPFGTLFIAWNVDIDYSHTTAPHYRLNFSEIMLYGGTPQLHAQTVFDFEQTEMGTVKEMYDFEEKVRPYLLDAELIPYAALVYERADYPGEWFKGYYRALIEAHISFRVIPRSRLTSDLSQHKALVFPNIATLSEAEIEAIQAFVARGGGLVMTYQTGSRYPDGTLRQDNPLLKLAGCKGPFGITTYPPSNVRPEFNFELGELRNYMRVVNESPIATKWAGRLQSFKGSYVKVEPDGGMVIANALDYDYTKSFHRHHPVIGWYPGDFHLPIAIVSETSGRVVYFAGELDAAALRQPMPSQLDLLTEAVVWAAGEKPQVTVNAPITVEMATHYSPIENSYTCFLVNQTTNQIEREWLVRHMQPINDIQIVLQIGDAKVQEVTALASGSVKWEQLADMVTVKLPILKEYEAIVVKL